MENDKGYESMNDITDPGIGVRMCISKEMPRLPIAWDDYGKLFLLLTLMRNSGKKYSPGLLEK